MCTNILHDMIYSSWHIECDRLKFVIMGHFLPSPLKTKKIWILKKYKKLLEISSFYTSVPKTTIIWSTVLEILSETDIWTIFCPFTPLTTQKIQILKKMEQIPGDIVLHKCTKSHDHMLYCSSDMAHNGCNFFFVFFILGYFLLFYLPNIPKNQNLKKWKKRKTLGDIIILQ